MDTSNERNEDVKRGAVFSWENGATCDFAQPPGHTWSYKGHAGWPEGAVPSG